MSPLAPGTYPTFGHPLPGNYPGNVRPNFYTAGPGTGFVRVGGYNQRGAVHSARMPWEHPPPPPKPQPTQTWGQGWPGAGFEPTRRLEAEEGQRGLEQLESQQAIARSRLQGDYGLAMTEYGRQEGEQQDALSKSLALLQESYAKLGTKQTEGANKAGLLSGGALLQAAAARAANEGKEATKQREAESKGIEAINRSRAKEILEQAPPDATNPLGGRAWQDLAEALRNAQSNQAFFTQGQQGLAWQEAGNAGYRIPTTPTAPAKAAAKPAFRPPPAPGGGVRLWNAGAKRMMTYRNGRWIG
jgi:hypothetical protein